MVTERTDPLATDEALVRDALDPIGQEAMSRIMDRLTTERDLANDRAKVRDLGHETDQRRMDRLTTELTGAREALERIAALYEFVDVMVAHSITEIPEGEA